jgi:hypothetical protein
MFLRLLGSYLSQYLNYVARCENVGIVPKGELWLAGAWRCLLQKFSSSDKCCVEEAKQNRICRYRFARVIEYQPLEACKLLPYIDLEGWLWLALSRFVVFGRFVFVHLLANH